MSAPHLLSSDREQGPYQAASCCLTCKEPFSAHYTAFAFGGTRYCSAECERDGLRFMVEVNRPREGRSPWQRVVGGFVSVSAAREWALDVDGGALDPDDECVTWRIGADPIGAETEGAMAS